MPFTDKELIVEKENGVVTVTLNRVEALNALTLEMVRLVSKALTRWEREADVKAIVFKGAGERAFCAGGDVKAAYTTGMDYRRDGTDERTITLFYAEEYRLNRQLFHYTKPTFAFMNGITMGGGFGVAGPCRYRIATENTTFAMPETNIGFFPDVGSTYFLSRFPGESGTYLALTGNNIGPHDALWTGAATHLINAQSINTCLDGIKEAASKDAAQALFNKTLEEVAAPAPEKGPVEEKAALIDRCFAANTVEDILSTLRADNNAWAQETARTIESRSPTSLKVTLAHLRKAKGADFNDVTARDYVLAQHFMKGHDFYEGVRAALVDKDKAPQWEPSRLDTLTATEINKYFQPASFGLDEEAA